MFRDAWRMHRDYFYDPKMHRVDWDAIGRRHEALLPRLTTRWELDHLISQMVGELSAMHTDIYAGDIRDATDGASLGHLGANFRKQRKGSGLSACMKRTLITREKRVRYLRLVWR